jgi:hypothetical protein
MVFGTKLCTFLSDRQRLTGPAFLDIDWDAMETATDVAEGERGKRKRRLKAALNEV